MPDEIEHDNDSADPGIVAKFKADEALPDGAVPVASLAIVWYIDTDGRDGYITKFDGRQRVSTTVGDLMALTHAYLHHDLDHHDDDAD